MNYENRCAVECVLENFAFNLEDVQSEIDAVRCNRMREQALNEIDWLDAKRIGSNVGRCRRTPCRLY